MIINCALLPGHPNSNIIYLTKRYKVPLIHIQLSGITLCLWVTKNQMMLHAFNILGLSENLILLEKNKKNFVSSYKYYDKQIVIKNGFIKKDKISIRYNLDIKKIISYAYSINIFDNKFSALEIFNDYILYHNTIQGQIIDTNNLKFWHESKIDTAIKKYGIPFDIISDCNGKSVWIYCGKHQCKANETLGIILLVFDEKNNMTGLYKYCHMCNKCTNQSDINFQDNIHYC